jgi:ribonuclease HII
MPPKYAARRPALEPKPSLCTDLRRLGFDTIVGADEVGRGAVAGPIVVATVEIYRAIPGVTDSKKLARHHRENLADKLHRTCKTLRLGIASNIEIDKLGVSRALSLAYERALADVNAHLVLTDHYDPPGQRCYIRATHGENLFYPVAAASIVAKTYRDQLMKVYSRFYPQYGWHQNAGYGTASHRQALVEFGVTPLHRQSFI